jgi:hypothetical protein
MLVAISILRGKWSDVVLGRDVTMVLDRIKSHGVPMRTPSILLRIGGFCMLLQVNILSRRGISWSVRSYMVSFNIFSLHDMRSVLRFCGLRMELKSPVRSQGARALELGLLFL